MREVSTGGWFGIGTMLGVMVSVRVVMMVTGVGVRVRVVERVASGWGVDVAVRGVVWSGVSGSLSDGSNSHCSKRRVGRGKVTGGIMNEC